MIHTELGDQLRRAREAKSVSVEEAERATGIRRRFIRAMEDGRFEELPGEIQLRGFLRNYGNYVGLNGEDLLALYERRSKPTQGTTAPQPATAVRPLPPQKPSSAPTATNQPTRSVGSLSPSPVAQAPIVQPPSPTAQAKPGQPAWMSRLPAWVTLEMLLIAIAVLMAICVIVLILLLVTNPGNGAPAAPRPVATPARITSSLSLAVSAESPIATAQPVATPTVKPTSADDFVQVALAATEHVWVRVTTDGKTAFEGMFAPGQALKWEAKDMLIVETGNGAGLTASFNNKPVGVLGPRGQIVARAWTPTGETAVPPKPTALLETPASTP
jgi:cytoskeletal protein RodZ